MTMTVDTHDLTVVPAMSQVDDPLPPHQPAIGNEQTPPSLVRRLSVSRLSINADYGRQLAALRRASNLRRAIGAHSTTIDGDDHTSSKLTLLDDDELYDFFVANLK